MTVDFLIEIDKLVQLIESPIFTCKDLFVLLNVKLFVVDLRLALLDIENNQTLIRALCGLLMLLPGKTDAFHTLRRRFRMCAKFYR